MSDDIDTRVVASFAPERYEEILQLMCDRALLPPSYAAWRRGFDDRITELHRRGLRPIVVEIDPGAFWTWCAAEEWPCDADARLEYADWLVALGQAPWALPEGAVVAAADRQGLVARDAEAIADWAEGAHAHRHLPRHEAAA